MTNVLVPVGLDRNSEEPIYRQLIRHVRAQIESGSLPSGSRLPASRDLAQQLNISRISVVNAYAELRAEGYLSAHAGRGTFVAGERAASTNGTGSADFGGVMLAEASPSALKSQADSAPIGDRSLRELMRLARKPGVINFSQGSPPLDFFPVNALRHAIEVTLDRDGARALGYEQTEGYGPLRAAVRDYVSALGIRCTSNQVLITGGTQQALDLVVQSILSEGETIVTENPTYLGMIDIARARRVNLHGIPIDEDGIRIDMLENYVLERQPRLIFVMPTFQNPTGRVMSLHRRRQLLNMAGEFNIPVLEDGVYHELRFDGESLPPLKALDDQGVVIHASGFTKNLLPGLRIGYVISDHHHYERLVRVKQAADISTPGLNQRAVHFLIERGLLSQQLERNNRELRRRRDAAMEACERHLPPGTRWSSPEGGLYLWIELPRNGPTAAELYISAIQHGVAYAIGSIFYPAGGGTYRLRLNYAVHRPAEIDEGMRRISRAWHEVSSDYADMEKPPLL